MNVTAKSWASQTTFPWFGSRSTPGPASSTSGLNSRSALTIWVTWPLTLHLADGLPAAPQAFLCDAKLLAWTLHWDFHQTFRDPLHLFHANLFYPAAYTLALSEHVYGVALIGFPLFAAGWSSLTAYNVLLLLGMAASALAAWALARYLTGDAMASLLAGVVYSFVPWQLFRLVHLHYHWGAFMALALLFLLRYLDGVGDAT